MRWGCGHPRPNNPVELTANSVGFLGHSQPFLLWAAAHRERCRGRFAPSTTLCGWPSPCCSARSASQQAAAADKPSGTHVCLRPCS
jgi:hypothetical protein